MGSASHAEMPPQRKTPVLGAKPRVCTKCQNQLMADAIFCRKCGSEQKEGAVETKPCKKCGSQLMPDAMFCRKCGTPTQEGGH